MKKKVLEEKAQNDEIAIEDQDMVPAEEGDPAEENPEENAAENNEGEENEEENDEVNPND